MALILAIETATPNCSIALGKDGVIVSLRERNEEKAHATLITVFIEEVMEESGYKLSDLDAVAVSMGPGSYTGLRIGVSTAKGLCYSLDKPLLGINTLQAMAYGFASATDEKDVLFCPMIDARRMEVFTAFFDKQNNTAKETSAEIIDHTSFSNILSERKVLFFGNGAAKCKESLSHSSNAVFIEGVVPSAQFIIPLAEAVYKKREFENVAYFEPFYLKDFVGTTPRQK